MKVLDNYLQYKKYFPNYAPWKKQVDDNEAKRVDYVKNNNIDEVSKTSDIKRARAVLDAVDVMDEYSQMRAEDTENATQVLMGTISSPICYAGLGAGAGLGALIAKLKNFPKDKAGIFVLGSSVVCMSIVSVILGTLFSFFSVKKETEASRKGRFEAMKNDLSNPNHFAQLTDEQEKEVQNLAKDIKIDKKEQKKEVKGTKGEVKGFFAALKALKQPDKQYLEERKEFIKDIEGDKTKFDNVKLSEKEIEEAKKDKQLIQSVVEKIDVASQSYAEDVELMTASISAIATGSSLLSAGLAYGVTKLFKASPKVSTIAAGIAAFAIMLPFGFFSNKIQKQASRVARWKVKQDFLNNPEKLYYVDDDKIKDSKVTSQNKEEKLGYFEKLKQVYEENKEYNAWLKKENIAKKQRQKALEQIKITPEQTKRAKQLQANVFKMFNKLDEKSQVFSESTEALSEIATNIIQGLALMGIELFALNKMSKKVKMSDGPKMALSFLLAVIPGIIINIFATKEQKRASKVADMLAINEMSDYKNFLDYSTDKLELNKDTNFEADNKNENKEQNKISNANNVFSKFTASNPTPH